MKSHRLLPILAAAFFAVAASAAELTVFAAASLADALKEIAPAYTKATGDTLRFNFGASGALARQIKEGAPADLIVSADELRVDQLEKAGLLLPETRRTILANQLVVIVAEENGAPVATLADLARPDVRRIGRQGQGGAVGRPDGLRQVLLGVVELLHQLAVALRLLQGIEVRTLNIFDDGELEFREIGIPLADDHWYLFEARELARPQAPLRYEPD